MKIESGGDLLLLLFLSFVGAAIISIFFRTILNMFGKIICRLGEALNARALTTIGLWFDRMLTYKQKKSDFPVSEVGFFYLIMASLIVCAIYFAPGEKDTKVAENPNSKQVSESGLKAPKEVLSGFVTKVVDGDTIHVAVKNQVIKVRYIGIDTPETKHPRKPVQCFGPEATKANIKFVLGKKVSLELDRSQDTYDRYDRLLAYVWVNDRLINLELIKGGFGSEYTYRNAYKYAKQFRAAERTARKTHIGKWNPETCPSKFASLKKWKFKFN